MQFEWALLAEREHSVTSLEKTTRTQAKVEKESQTYDTISLEWFMNEKSTQLVLCKGQQINRPGAEIGPDFRPNF